MGGEEDFGRWARIGPERPDVRLRWQLDRTVLTTVGTVRPLPALFGSRTFAIAGFQAVRLRAWSAGWTSAKPRMTPVSIRNGYLGFGAHRASGRSRERAAVAPEPREPASRSVGRGA